MTKRNLKADRSGAPPRAETMPDAYAESLVDHAVAIVSFDHARLAKVEGDIARWKVDVDERAALSGLPTLSNCDQAVAQIAQAKFHLTRGSMIPATYYLDRAEGIYSMRNIDVSSATRILHAAKDGRGVARGRARGGNTAAVLRKSEAAARESHLKAEAKKIRKLHPTWPVSELARSLSERQELGGFQAIYRKLLRLLHD